MSVPDCSICAANEWREVCTETCLAMEACATASFNFRPNLSSNKWCRRSAPVRGSMDSVFDGETQCQAHDCPTLGNLASSACGIKTPAWPEARSAAHTDDLLVQKEQSIQRLAMGGRRNSPIVDQHGEEGLDLRIPHILGVAHGAVAAMPTDEKASPIQVGFFSLKAIVQVTNALTKLVQQPNRAKNGSGDFVRFNTPVHKYNILLQVYENKRFFDEQRNTLSDWLPCYPAKLPDTLKLCLIGAPRSGGSWVAPLADAGVLPPRCRSTTP